MILAACEGRGKGAKDAEGLARAESGEGSGKSEVGRADRKEGGWGGVDGNGEGETGRGNLEGGNGEGSNRDGRRVAMEKGAMGKGGGDGKGRGRWEGGNGERAKGKEVGMEMGRRRGKIRGDFTDGYDGMPGWTHSIGLMNGCKQIECLRWQRLSRSLIATRTWNAWVEWGYRVFWLMVTLFTRATPGTPASIYIIQIYSGITCGRVLNGELYTCKLYKLINLCWSTGCFVKLHFTPEAHFTKQPVDQHRLTYICYRQTM